jgi:hypothetical protein
MAPGSSAVQMHDASIATLEGVLDPILADGGSSVPA